MPRSLSNHRSSCFLLRYPSPVVLGSYSILFLLVAGLGGPRICPWTSSLPLITAFMLPSSGQRLKFSDSTLHPNSLWTICLQMQVSEARHTPLLRTCPCPCSAHLSNSRPRKGWSHSFPSCSLPLCPLHLISAVWLELPSCLSLSV